MARQTSIDAYNKIRENGLLSKRKWQVYDLLFHNGPLTGGEVAALMKIEKGVNLGPNANTTSRLSELRDLGVAAEVGEKPCRVTGHGAYLWDVTAGLPIKLKKPVSKDKQIKELKEDCMALAAELVSVQEELNILKSRDADKT